MQPPIAPPPHLTVEAMLVEDKSYRVRDLRTGALHVLRLCPGPAALVRRRIAALAAISAPALVVERELVDAGGRTFTLRPWIEGRPLELTEAELSSFLGFIVRAVEPLHAAGVAHGRIHAGNLIRDERGQLHLVDAADPLPALDASGALRAAPEQLRGEAATVRTDVHAIGLLAFEACTGRVPFVGAPWVELARRALYEGVEFTFEEAARLDPGVVAAIRRALARKPKARFASVGELVRGLSRLPQRSHHVADFAAAVRSRVQPRILARVGTAVSLVGASVAAVALVSGGGLEREVATLIERSDYGRASVVLASARREGADAALVEKLEGDLACARGGEAECLDHYERALVADAGLASDETIRRNVLTAFQRADGRWRVAKLAAKLEDVDDALLRNATDTHYWIRWNAVRALEERGLKKRIPWGVVYGLDVLHAGSCSTRERALRKVVQESAVDALPYLKQAQAKADGQLFGDGCLGSDLGAAIRRLEKSR